jgi:hypothetical protein
VFRLEQKTGKTLSVTFEGGRRYYLAVKNMWYSRWAVVGEAEGEEDIQRLSPLPEGLVQDRDRVVIQSPGRRLRTLWDGRSRSGACGRTRSRWVSLDNADLVIDGDSG